MTFQIPAKLFLGEILINHQAALTALKPSLHQNANEKLIGIVLVNNDKTICSNPSSCFGRQSYSLSSTTRSSGNRQAAPYTVEGTVTRCWKKKVAQFFPKRVQKVATAVFAKK